jgi:TIR domain-containing protein
MKIFLSWHGKRSRAVAEALNDWLRRVIQAVKPFYSPEIEKGAKWSSEIDGALEGTRFGIICLTPDNLDSTWIHYEAGALSKTKDALIWTFLHELTAGDVPQPLGKFQHTIAEKADTFQLLRTINARLAEVGAEPLSDGLLQDNFELFWPKLEERLNIAKTIPLAKTTRKPGRDLDMPRDDREILNEILELVRNQERRLSALEEQPSSHKIAQKEATGLLTLTIPNSWSSDVGSNFLQELAESLGTVGWHRRGNTATLRFINALPASEIEHRINEASTAVSKPDALLDWHYRISKP